MARPSPYSALILLLVCLGLSGCRSFGGYWFMRITPISMTVTAIVMELLKETRKNCFHFQTCRRKNFGGFKDKTDQC